MAGVPCCTVRRTEAQRQRAFPMVTLQRVAETGFHCMMSGSKFRILGALLPLSKGLQAILNTPKV